MRPIAKDPSLIPAACAAETKESAIRATNKGEPDTAAAIGTQQAAKAKPAPWQIDEAGSSTQTDDTSPACVADETTHNKSDPPHARNQAHGMLAGVDFDTQRPVPVPDSDGQLRCALIWCPDLPGGTRFILIRRHESGNFEKLEDGLLIEQAPSLNLARLRQRGAQLGANEVVLFLPQACASLDC
ncbi:MAG TPA: hypothetical protein P5114_01705 [Hyphomicrobiaceae bacterium]|nr:hypothetical protein [Hyphomicrobiaceae bacterium]